jgi:hypothetical protein
VLVDGADDEVVVGDGDTAMVGVALAVGGAKADGAVVVVGGVLVADLAGAELAGEVSRPDTA